MARILIIEDSPTEAAVMTGWLQKKGHVVSAAGNAEEGIERCRSEQPDLVLMDVVLPGMNGFQATRLLSRDDATRHIPILIVSTKGLDVDQHWGMRQGARDYVVKPPQERDLMARIDTLLAG